MTTMTKKQVQKIIDAADAVITAMAGTNDDVHPDNHSKMCQLYDELNDRYATPEIVRELARIALQSIEVEPIETQITELKDENEYIRKRFKELDRMFGKNLLVMQAAIIEWRTTGDAKNGMAWIFNTLFGPGELPSEDEKDAQAYFDREYAPIDKELMELSDWFHEYHKCLKEKQLKNNG